PPDQFADLHIDLDPLPVLYRISFPLSPRAETYGGDPHAVRGDGRHVAGPCRAERLDPRGARQPRPIVHHLRVTPLRGDELAEFREAVAVVVRAVVLCYGRQGVAAGTLARCNLCA